MGWFRGWVINAYYFYFVSFIRSATLCPNFFALLYLNNIFLHPTHKAFYLAITKFLISMRIQPHCFPLRYDNHATNLSQLSANNIYSARKNSNTRHGNHSQHASPQAIFHCRNHILHFMLSLQLANTHHSPFLQQLVASLATSHMHSVQL